MNHSVAGSNACRTSPPAGDFQRFTFDEPQFLRAHLTNSTPGKMPMVASPGGKANVALTQKAVHNPRTGNSFYSAHSPKAKHALCSGNLSVILGAPKL
jgi:hypothetical protein